MITVRNLSRKYGAKYAIEDLSFHLERGEVVGFLGPNGAGKTTTMRILAGYLPASSGVAEVGGLDVLRHSLAVRKTIGYLPEAVPLYREHRVREMLDFQGRLHGLRRAERRARIPAVLERVGIADRTESIVGTLSRGQRQRVGLAVALLPDPKVLILDEPTSGLDPLQRLEVRKLLAELASERTVLLSSHILSEVEAVCPRVIILRRGKIAADGRKEDLVKRLGGAAFVRFEAFVGQDVAAAVRSIRSVRGVRDVVDRGRLGIHHVFEVHSEEDLREDLGALALTKGWAVRELSWSRPTLEELFARIALELGDSHVTGAPPVASSGPGNAGTSAPVLFSLPISGQPVSVEPPSAPPPSPKPAGYQPLNPFEKPAAAPPKVVYNLNPFDRGASRDLSKPKAIEPVAQSGTAAKPDNPAGAAAKPDNPAGAAAKPDNPAGTAAKPDDPDAPSAARP